ncbi:hypothetical protein [Vibrio apostichopi]|uniref:hypothetical protein n=1 Tax=Vibrio apostichopi TaxID=3035453 RepID=UPI002574483B|nr:hypothetical protein [Vibrio sp. FE10]
MISDKVISGIENGEISLWILGVIVAIAVLKSHKEIFQTFIDFKANKFKKLENAIACEWVSDDKKDIFKAELEQLHIAEACGIKCSVDIRNELLDIYSTSQKGIRLLHFQRAASLVRLESGELLSNINNLQRYWYYIELITGICLWVITIPVICILVYATLSSGVEFPSGILLLIPIAGFLAYDGAKIMSLKHVLTEYKTLQEHTGSKELKAAA